MGRWRVEALGFLPVFAVFEDPSCCSKTLPSQHDILMLLHDRHVEVAESV